LGGSGLATIAATHRNEVGYLIVAVAPADRWPSINPVFQGMLNSFRFTEETVIRPTDATPPPTPTPTPTPRIYVVQPGDTLSQIAFQFDVSVEALAARNSIEDPRNLQTGQKLIIPTRR
jgi:LysM repeat protein